MSECVHATPVSPAKRLVSSSLEPWDARGARAAFLTMSDKPTRDASRARGRASGPRRSPCSHTLLPKHARVCPGAEDQGRRHHRLPGRSRGREATQPPRRAPFATRRWPWPRPCSRTSCPWGQTLPRPAGGQLYEQQQGRRLPPTPADPGALPLPEGGGTLGRPLCCPPRARGSTGGSGLTARRLPLDPAPAIRCPAPASGQKQHVFSGGRRGGSSF